MTTNTDDPGEPDFEWLPRDGTVSSRLFGKAKCVCGEVIDIVWPARIVCPKCKRSRSYAPADTNQS